MAPVYFACAIVFSLTSGSVKVAFDIPWPLAFALTTMFTLIIGGALLCGALVANPSLNFP